MFAPSQTAGLHTLDPTENAHGVAIVNVAIQLAGCIGPALYVGIFSSQGFTASIAVAGVVACMGFLLALYYSRRA